MKQGRTPPDRVHVVRPPQDDFRDEAPSLPTQPAPNSRAIEIIRTLAAISDKLKRSEAERYELLAELREYRRSLNELEDKADKSEKAYLTLEHKIKNRDTMETEISQRQARFERALKETENKLVQAAAGQNLLDQRIKSTEDFQTGVGQRFDEFVTHQARYDRQLEKIGQDKTRMLRKVERMEEIVSETQEALKARALVLLTDQSAAAQSSLPQLSAMSAGDDESPWWRRSVRMQSVGMISMVVAALLFGWTINQVQQPDMPQIAVLENGGLARLNMQEKKWEQITVPSQAQIPAETSVTEQTPAPATFDIAPPQAQEAQAALPVADTATPETPETVTEQTPAAQAVLESSDEQLMAALEENPEQLATQLNEIAPEVAKAPEQTPRTPEPAASSYDPLQPLRTKAFAQDPGLANKIAAELGTGDLASRIQPDPSLPPSMKKLEEQAFADIPEAQHDLAAIYTAGRPGITQNFEKAALWFREAADNHVANASYNLGVLYHQGLGVERDLDRALYWYREAAKLGHPEAQYNLGISYIEGIGAEYNAPLAAAFFESAANKGIIEAAYNLGLIYENGLIAGGPKQEDALLWYKIAADGGNADAKAALSQLSSQLQIGPEDVNKMVDRMQAIYISTKGRPAGAEPKALPNAG